MNRSFHLDGFAMFTNASRKDEADLDSLSLSLPLPLLFRPESRVTGGMNQRLDKEGEKEECRAERDSWNGKRVHRATKAQGGGGGGGESWEDEAKEYGARRRAVRRGTELERSRNVIISVVNLTHSMEWAPTTTTTTMI